jgi:hypothetical protein
MSRRPDQAACHRQYQHQTAGCGHARRPIFDNVRIINGEFVINFSYERDLPQPINRHFHHATLMDNRDNDDWVFQ